MLETALAPWPSFTQDEADKVANVLLSNKVNYWTGREARSFELEMASFYDANYAIALANGTLALELALISLGVGPGDEVIVTPRTFIASVSSIVSVGATPVFVDIERNSGNISVETISPALSKKTKAVICVHIAGWPCEMDGIMKLADQHGFYVIEDCAQAHGSSYKGRRLGSIGHVSAFSFCQDKIMTTGGEGGMFICNDEALWRKAWSYKDHGKSWAAVYEQDHGGGYRWLHESFGTNWRMTEMQACLGRHQLAFLDEWSQVRKANAQMYNKAASVSAAITVPQVPEHIDYVPYKHYMYVRSEYLKSGWSRDRLITVLNDRGVPCFSGTCSEVYLEKAFDGTGWRPDMPLPIASELGETSLCFLVHPTITKMDLEKVCRELASVLLEATA